jgi:hypothetical protein
MVFSERAWTLTFEQRRCSSFQQERPLEVPDLLEQLLHLSITSDDVRLVELLCSTWSVAYLFQCLQKVSKEKQSTGLQREEKTVEEGKGVESNVRFAVGNLKEQERKCLR